MIDEVFRKNKTTQKFEDAEERFLKISPLPNGSKVVDTRSSRLTYVADPVDDKDAINKSWATKYFKDEKDAITKLSESATAKSAEIDTKLVKFNSDKESIERTGEELKVLSAETKTRAEETKTKLESTLAQLEQAKTKIDNFNADYARAKELKGDVEGKFNEVKANLESVKAVLSNVTAKSADILSTYTNAMQGIQNSYIAAKQDLQSIGNTAKQDINNLANRTKQEIATTKASIDTKANEALSQASTALTDIRGIIADFRGKQTELNALKASLETLKNSLENLNKSGLINDTQAGIAQTYSSNKINNLLQGVLRESDASEGNANGKLVRRNAQGNIYATNVYLNATTKAEVSDIKNALASDRWRFIVRDTGEGLLRSMSIKDFMSSQEVDAYTKAQSDSKYLTEAKGDTRYVKTADADLAYMRVNNAYTQTEIDKWFAKKTELTALTNSLGDTYIKKTDADSTYVKSTSPIFNNLLKADVDTQGKYKDHAYVLKAPDGSNIKSLAFSASPFTFPAPDPLNQQASLGTYAFLLFKNEANNRQALYVQPAKALWDYVTKQIKDYYKSFNKPASLSQIDLSEYVNFEVTLKSTAPFYTIMGIEEAIGQSGVIIVHNAANITGWNSMFKWREGVPTALKGTEVFAYFVASATEIYMGRA